MSDFENKIFAGSNVHNKIKKVDGEMYGNKLYFAGIRIVEDKLLDPNKMYTLDPKLAKIIEDMKNEP